MTWRSSWGTRNSTEGRGCFLIDFGLGVGGSHGV